MKICKKFLIIFIFIVNCIELIVCGAQIPNSDKPKDRLEAIKEKGVLTIASANDLPFAYMDPKTKEFTGIDEEILNEVAKRLGINKVQMKQVKFKDLLTQLNNDDEIDIVANGLYVTDERQKEALFTNIWYKDSEAIITPRVSKIVFKEDLKNATIGVVTGTVYLELAQKWQKEGVVKNIVEFESLSDLLSAVNAGKVDAGIVTSIFAEYMISQNKNLYLTILPPTNYISEYPGKVAAAVRKSDTTLAEAINEKVDELKDERIIEKILRKYGLNEKYFVSIKDEHM